VTFLPLFDLTSDTFRTPSISMLGLELGPSTVRAALIEGGKIVRRHEQPLAPAPRPDVVIDAIVQAALRLEASPKVAGIAIPGELDGSGRCWGMEELPGFDGVYIAEELAARLGCPVSIESDGQSAALGERVHGRGRGHASLLSVVIGERLSAGLVLDGQLRRGKSGFGASIAHVCVDTSEAARSCVCGRRGCLLAYASLRALTLEYEQAGGDRAAGLDVVERAGKGEAAAVEAVRRLGVALGAGLALVQNMLDLDAVTLVSSAPALFGLLEPQLRQALRERVFGPAAGEIPVFESLLGRDAVLIGAAELALRGVTENA
jgi:predicted NBD/HSP70 family sugar kinase